MLYQLIYREHQQAQSGLIEAGSLAKAEELGRGWCDGKAGRRYVAVRDAVLCRELIVAGTTSVGVGEVIQAAEAAGQKAVEEAVRKVGGK